MTVLTMNWFYLFAVVWLHGGEVDAFYISFIHRNVAVRQYQQRRCQTPNICRSVLATPSDTDDNNSSIDPIFDQGNVPDIPSNFNDEEQGNVNIPSTGISISDEIEASQKDRFVTDVIPINGMLPGTAAQLITVPTLSGSFEPVRYLVALSPPSLLLPVDNNVTSHRDHNSTNQAKPEGATGKKTDYIMVDIPPYSKQLVDQIKDYLMTYNGQLQMIVSTNRNSIHFDEAPTIYSTRRADFDLWCKAYPNIQIVAYRLDIPRDCRYAITQVLDGYGPFALDEHQAHNNSSSNTWQFVESGRPLSVVEWDHAVSQDAFTGKPIPDDDETESKPIATDNEDLYSPQAIRKREQGKRLLAIYTPGYTFGSVTYIFPESGLCCSGFAIPVEDNRFDENQGIGGTTGPALDCRGYIANSKNRKRHAESAKDLVSAYVDRFSVILPSRGDPLFLDNDEYERRDLLLETLSQYERIGSIYEQLGIISSESDY